VPVKIFTDGGSGNTLMLQQGLQYCVDNSDIYNIAVITMSIGIVYDENNSEIPYNDYCDGTYSYLVDEINSAVAKNISVVAATGNYLDETGITAPACIENVIPVGATNKADTIYYNRNSLVKLLSPGVSINSTMLLNPLGDIGSSCGTGNLYCSLNGTSMATPHVSAGIGIISQFLNLSNITKTPSQIEEILFENGKIIKDPTNSSQNFSRINVYSTILSLDETAPNINLVSPSDNMINITQNQSFSFNASDWQLKNATLYVWNS
jgi:subtilisin family serine protease